MDNHSPANDETAVAWQGIHHIALVTPDLDATIHFYREVLGMRLSVVMPATGGRGRHAFLSPGGEGLGLHFFEVPDAELRNAWEMIEALQTSFLPGAFQHIAFTLPDEGAALALRERMAAHGVTMTDVNDLGRLRNFLFPDNNGILLEAIWPQAESVSE